MSDLGRFGHHSDPAIDFCVEIDVVQGMVADLKAGLEKRQAVEDRISKAMAFRVGGDQQAVAAKAALRHAEAEVLHLLGKEA